MSSNAELAPPDAKLARGPQSRDGDVRVSHRARERAPTKALTAMEKGKLAMTRIDWPFRPSSATIPMHLSLLFDGFGDEKAMRNFKVIMLAGQWLEALRTRR